MGYCELSAGGRGDELPFPARPSSSRRAIYATDCWSTSAAIGRARTKRHKKALLDRCARFLIALRTTVNRAADGEEGPHKQASGLLGQKTFSLSQTTLERTLALRTCCSQEATQFEALFEKVTLTPLKRRIDPFGF